MNFRDNRIKLMLVFLIGLVASSGNVWAQDLSPVTWSFSYDETSKRVLFDAKIEDGWHLYATEQPSDEGPLPTEFVFEESKHVDVDEKGIIEAKPIASYDPNFDTNIRYFAKETVFEFPVQVKSKNEEVFVEGYVSFMVCDDERCLPPVDKKFKIKVK